MNKTCLMSLSLAVALFGCTAHAPQPAEEPPLAGAAIGGDFKLTDQNGKPFDSATLNGKYRIIYFGYTYCPDVCPVDMQKIMAGLTLFEKQNPERGAEIQPLFISIDPERDTPAVLKQYVAAFHPRLIGLTGSLDEVTAVAKKYLILFSKQQDAGMSGYLVDHSRQAYLFGPKGEPLALLPYDGTPQDVAKEIDRWAR